MTRPALFFQLRQAEFTGDLLKQRQLALVAAELVLLVAQRFGVTCGPGVFQVGAERRVSQPGATVELVVFQLGEYAKALGIALETEKVATFGRTHRIQPATSGGLLKPMADGIFTGMAKGRITNVVSQAGGLHDHAQVARLAPVRQGIADHLANAHTQRTAHAADFQRVGQAGVDMVVTGNRVHLSLAAQAAEGAGEDDAVMVFVKRGAAQFGDAVRRLAESFTVEQGLPIQGLSSPLPGCGS